MSNLRRCETCKSVTIYPACCATETRALTSDEAKNYIAKGHEAFADTVAIKVGGKIVRYEPAAGTCTNCGNPSADLQPVTVEAYGATVNEKLCPNCRAALAVSPDAKAVTL